MSDNSDRMIEYEERNWNELAEKFIEKYRTLWEEFVFEKYDDWCNSQEPPDFDDDFHPEDKDEPEPEKR